MLSYGKELINVQNEFDNITKKYNNISNLRLIISIVGLFMFILVIAEKKTLFLYLFILCSIFFISLIVYHEKIKVIKDYSEAKLNVLTKHIDRQSNRWSIFEETGSDFLTEQSTIERDLDIFGMNSLYQYLCVCNTQEGKKILSSYLKNNDFESKVLYERQKAVNEFIEKEELALEIETLSMLIGMKSEKKSKDWYDSFLDYLKRDRPLLNSIIKKSCILLPLTTLTSLLFATNGIININISFILAFLQLVLSYYINYRNKEITNKVFRFCSNIRGYYRIVKFIETADFSSEYLVKLKNYLSSDYKATKGIEKLDHLNEAFLVQANPYVHILLQMLFMYDIHCINKLETWKKKYANNMMKLFQVIGELEAILSLSIIGKNRKVCFPSFVDEKGIVFDSHDLAHPLIPTDSVVRNSIHMNHGIEIITGSNMSGKTTFLRTIGINVILAYAGAPVCAKNMNLSFMKMFTSMRVQDDVSKGVSSFYAEVLRIKEMVEYSKLHKNMLILIDEIFKGTNSADRIAGAKEIIKGLNRKYVIAAVSTHDFELCSLVEQNKIIGRNHHFQEYYVKDKIHFDYKIREGRCRTTNANHILRMAGLI